MVAGGRRPPSRKLSQLGLYRWSYTAGIRPPSATRDKVTVCVVLQRENDQARSRTIHNDHDRSCVWQHFSTVIIRALDISKAFDRVDRYGLLQLWTDNHAAFSILAFLVARKRE